MVQLSGTFFLIVTKTYLYTYVFKNRIKKWKPENCPCRLSGLRQTWKKQSSLGHSGKTWKTQGILEKYFKSLENSGNSAEIDFLINLLYFLATIYFKWHYSLFTLYTTVIAGFFYLHILFGLSGWLLFEILWLCILRCCNIPYVFIL